ncbi:MAG TPA: riboflavin synthase, partial [Solirubrobacteraceae bacterium]|nr:riboflavin synthase [Solirubrobacteraceae bacterium]
MFTGLVQELGRVTGVRRSDDGVRLEVRSRAASELAVGDSVAVNGVCLTAVVVDDGSFEADVMNETLQRSSLREARPGAGVNIELPMRAGDRFGGHLVQGHVDGIGTVSELQDDGFARRVRVSAPADVMRYIVEKGSIAVDGISLTVAELDDASFTVSLIPETIARTNLADARQGTIVNLEVDVLAKY